MHIKFIITCGSKKENLSTTGQVWKKAPEKDNWSKVEEKNGGGYNGRTESCSLMILYCPYIKSHKAEVVWPSTACMNEGWEVARIFRNTLADE